MSRRPSLPGAAELFRATGGASRAVADVAESTETARRPQESVPDPQHTAVDGPAAALAAAPPPEDLTARRTTAVRRTARRRVGTGGDRWPSGRERHEEKITVYCSADELLDLESARLTLRAEHGLVVDRGRIVREALAVVLADLEAKGDSSVLVRRLAGR